MKIVFVKDALADLRAIARWVGQDYLDRGDKFVDQLRRRCGSLLTYPRRFPVAIKLAGYEVRKLAFRRYLIFYTVTISEITILRVVHGATDWPSLFATESKSDGF